MRTTVVARDPPREICPKARPISPDPAPLDAAASEADSTVAGNEIVAAGDWLLTASVVSSLGDAMVIANGGGAFKEPRCA